jgi:probable F420-dependent oxidoreductase
MSRPFRFGCQYFTPESAAQWRDTAREAEDLGYSAFHVADHYFGPGPAQQAASHPVQTVAAIPAMMAAAAATTTIKVGCRVLCVDYHHPLVLAKELATIDLLSDGRLEAGFGAGWITTEYASMGITMDRPGVRIDRMVEYVELARAFFAGRELAFDGPYVTARDMTAVPAAVQPGGPRIMIGGGAQRVLRTAGRLADIVSINFDNSAGKLGQHGIHSGTAAGTQQKLAWVREGAGDRFDDLEIEIAAYFTTVTDKGQATTEAMAGAFGLDPAALAEHPHTLIGSVDEICETLQRRRTDYGISYITVGEKSMRAFAPVVARLAGT